jgi:hypothetical protein
MDGRKHHLAQHGLQKPTLDTEFGFCQTSAHIGEFVSPESRGQECMEGYPVRRGHLSRL